MTVHSYVLSQLEFVDRHSLTYPFEERGLQFGDGVYEVIRVYGGNYYLKNEHVDRLFRSAEAVKIDLPFSKDELHASLSELLSKNNVTGNAKVYLQATRGSATRDHVFPSVPANFYAYVQDMPRPEEKLRHGVSAIVRPDIRWQNCYIKSLNLLPNVLAKQEASEYGAYEAILHRDGKVTECSSSNVYIVKKGTVYTHPETNQILHGCVRARVKQLAYQEKIPFVEAAFSATQLMEADEVFVTSSTSEVMPIVQVDNQTIGNGKPGNITSKLQHAYAVDANIADYSIVGK
ncbi:D-amino-acid transaminase [Radiobacillus kanasensis]|uniref:D-amino-acid transaminase n=1 Tax=Radiobacillus kanasensis TaxID=2844358 RepID=UPI001E6009A0|nr:D-amino-acid transaminase [Radiobacillus kanasensis]UFU00317.1 D-amino-acid transaminase [Radiobacillus kanasensis]